jgi:hypothetical protein
MKMGCISSRKFQYSSLYSQMSSLDLLIFPQIFRGRMIDNLPLAHDINIISQFKDKGKLLLHKKNG